VYGVAAAAMLLPMVVMVVFAKEPPDVDAHASLRQHVACLFEKDGWTFSLIYGVTFGGFIGLTTFLPTYYHDQFGVTKIQAGQLTMLAAFMAAAVRVVGGWISDRWGGVNTLTVVLVCVAFSLVAVSFASSSLALTTLLLMLCFAALGAGNGALFQLVPLRWPTTTAVAGSMIGEIGALGGGLVPNAMGLSKQHLGTYQWGFVLFAAGPALGPNGVAVRAWHRPHSAPRAPPMRRRLRQLRPWWSSHDDGLRHLIHSVAALPINAAGTTATPSTTG
jgi:MFS transporter, NNP family, nitrate/nitrite transporter